MDNQIKKGTSLAHVVMPLVRVMDTGGLSWADREVCASAIQSALRHWWSMEDERRMMEMKECAGMAVSAAVGIKSP